MIKSRSDSGQVALILVLVMTVIASAAVALSARTSVETRVQEINIDSSQAMLAAQSGLEQALKNGTPGQSYSGNLGNGASFTASDKTIPAGQSVYQGVKRGESIEINTVGATANNLTLMWRAVGSDPSAKPRAIFVSVISPAGVITDYAFDTVGGGTPTTLFQLADASLTPGFTYQKTIGIAGSAKVTVLALGGDIDIGFAPVGGTIADQMRQTQTTGIVTRGSGATAETLQYGLGYNQSTNTEVPEVFQYAMFSGQSISQ